jgi:hypothetical protein
MLMKRLWLLPTSALLIAAASCCAAAGWCCAGKDPLREELAAIVSADD